MKNNAPELDGLVFLNTIEDDDRVTHNYRMAGQLKACVYCGSDKLHKAGSRMSTFRHDVHRMPKGNLPLFISITRKACNCMGCGRKPYAPIPVPLAHERQTKHFWEIVRASKKSLKHVSSEFCMSVAAVKRARSDDGNYKMRVQQKRKQVSNQKPEIPQGIYTAIYTYLREQGPATINAIRRHLAEIGMAASARAVSNAVTEQVIIPAPGGRYQNAPFIAAYLLPWPASGSAPKTMLGKCRADRPVIRVTPVGYDVHIAA